MRGEHEIEVVLVRPVLPSRDYPMRTRLIALLVTITVLLSATAIHFLGNPRLAHLVLRVGVVCTGFPIAWRTTRGVLRGRFASDVVATLSIVGAIALDQPIVGLVIVLMQTGGEALERYAEGRASAAVRALEAAAPRTAHRIDAGDVVDIPATSVAIGDVLLIRAGDLVPCDGVVVDGESDLDTSSLTGEATPMRATPGTKIMSGMVNGLGSFQMRASAIAEQSQYARIVELVRSAQASKSPLQRMADRYAVWFTPITLAACAIAVAVTHDWTRALAILVVATPCPLILATPVAIIGGINRAAKNFVIVRHGGALERLGSVNAAVFDKTGTITVGKPSVAAIRTAAGTHRTTVLRYAAAVEQYASHSLARVLVDFARAADTQIPASRDHLETPGRGITGIVDGHAVRIGARSFVIPMCSDTTALDNLEADVAELRAYVSIDGRLVAVVEYADRLRPELGSVIDDLTHEGVRRIALLSGDHEATVEEFARRARLPEFHGDMLPTDKVRFIERLRKEGSVVMMIGDGINDAPALSSADVGIAMAAHGGGITAEAADVVVLADSLEGIPEVIRIARRTIRIARQSIWVGLGLSAVGMIVAAVGALPPMAGAVAQEALDVAVILNALRASISSTTLSPAPTARRDLEFHGASRAA
jgi:heavy metal translocating P-type ATPase